ncbi:hypothetical protein FOZ62_006891, partial [Perkinsus olseni]
LAFCTMFVLVPFWQRSLCVIVLPALAFALRSSTQKSRKPSFSTVLVNKAIRDDVLQSTTRVVSGIYEVIFEHGEYADPLTVSQMVCPDPNPRATTSDQLVTAYLFPEGLS